MAAGDSDDGSLTTIGIVIVSLVFVGLCCVGIAVWRCRAKKQKRLLNEPKSSLEGEGMQQDASGKTQERGLWSEPQDAAVTEEQLEAPMKDQLFEGTFSDLLAKDQLYDNNSNNNAYLATDDVKIVCT